MSNGKLFFDLAEAVRIAEATITAPEHTDSFADQDDGTKTGPALMWVKDDGTYLMSNAIPRPENDVLYGRANSPDGLLLNGSDTWEATREICGGDDFAEYFKLDELLPNLRAGLAQGLKHLMIEVSDDSVGIEMKA